ncbi:MAG: histidine kinase [Hymenobacter sp.]|nr:histidine kinase [Hymenobacter sp.]
MKYWPANRVQLLLGACLLALPAGAARAQAPAPLAAPSLPAGLSNPDSLRAWAPGRPTADTVRIKALIEEGRRHIGSNLDSTRALVQQGVALAWARHQGPGLLAGLTLLAAATYYASDYPAAQHAYELALWAARRCQRPRNIGNAYMGLGLVARGLEDQAGSERYFVRAQQAFATATPRNREGELTVLANRAYNFLDRDSTARRAAPLARQAVRLLAQLPEAKHPGKYWSLLGMVQEHARHPDSATATFGQAVRVAHATHDANAEAEALVHLANLALRRADYPRALQQARQAEKLFHALGDVQEADALKAQAAALAGLHQPGAYETLRRYTVLYDSAVNRQRAEEVTLTQARFGRAEQQARIQALEQQRRITDLEEQQRTTRSRLLLGALAGGGVLLGLGIFGWYRQRQRRREAALRRQLAADLHDDVGGLLARIALQTDLMQEGLGAPDQRQSQLAEVAGNSRLAVRQLNDVVWNLDAHNDSVPSLLDRLRDYAHEVLVPTGRDVRFITDEAPASGPDLTPPVRRQLYLIFKEALHNILKHAPADATVTVALHQTGRALALTVANTGPVVAPHGRTSGHGLRNMQVRAATLGGTATAEALAEGGFAVRVQVPL